MNEVFILLRKINRWVVHMITSLFFGKLSSSVKLHKYCDQMSPNLINRKDNNDAPKQKLYHLNSMNNTEANHSYSSAS